MTSKQKADLLQRTRVVPIVLLPALANHLELVGIDDHHSPDSFLDLYHKPTSVAGRFYRDLVGSLESLLKLRQRAQAVGPQLFFPRFCLITNCDAAAV